MIELDQDQARLVMYEGKLSASTQGSIVLAGSEEAVAGVLRTAEGTAVRPLDAVQWALFYPILDFRPDEQVVMNRPCEACAPLRTCMNRQELLKR